MNLLLVTFSLRNPLRDYTQFFVALRGNSLNWWHFIEQTCLVTTRHDVRTFAHLLYPHMEKTDSLLIVKPMPHEFEGWLPEYAWDWLFKVSEEAKLQDLHLLPPPDD